MVNIGHNIKILLRDNQLTQREVAERMGISPGALSNAIKGENPRISTLEHIANAIGCKVGDFFIDEVSPTGTMTALVRHGSNYYSAETTDELRRIADEIDGKSADR